MHRSAPSSRLLLAACNAAPTFPMSFTIVDSSTGAPVPAAVFADDQQVAQNVSERTLELPTDGQRHAVAMWTEAYQERRSRLRPAEGDRYYRPSPCILGGSGGRCFAS